MAAIRVAQSRVLWCELAYDGQNKYSKKICKRKKTIKQIVAGKVVALC